jgi:TonB dependent receptor
VETGELLAAVELEHYDGPWVRPDDYRKENGLVRYSQGDAANGFTVTLGAYNGEWNSTDQIPERAVAEGLISRFGAIDPTDGGSTYHYSLSAELRRGDDSSLTTLSTFVYNSKMKLFSDFTYFLDDPVHGDQFEQSDYRTVEGFSLKHEWTARWRGMDVESTVGLQGRNDNIHDGLFHTEDQVVLSLTRADFVDETSIGPYAQTLVHWTSWLRTVTGLRADYYIFNVDSNLAENSGYRDRAIAEPKMSVILGPWKSSEFYLNYGEGFHSNDARGTTIEVDPQTGKPIAPVSPLVRAKSADVGFRTSVVPNLQTSISFFRLDLASELVFDGDAGDTEPSRPSRRLGFEIQNYYRPGPWLVVDADFALSRARFTDFETIGQYIPGAIQTAAAVGVTVPTLLGFSSSLRWRYFGPRPLIEDDSVSSRATSLVYFDIGHDVVANLKVTLAIFNLLNSQASDIDYYYTSRLPGEPAQGVNDIHFHPSEPRSFRLSAAYRF